MKVTGKNSVSRVLKIMLQIILVFGIIVVITLPLVVDAYINFLRTDLENIKTVILVLLYVVGVPTLLLVYEFIYLFKSLEEDTLFIKSNSIHLRKASKFCFIIALEFMLSVFVLQSIFIFVIIGIFLIAWIGLYILSELFRLAVEYKEENELTI